MSTIGTLVVKLVGDVGGFQASMKDAETTVRTSTSSITDVLGGIGTAVKVAAGAAVAGFGAMAAGLGVAVKEAADAQIGIAQTEAVIKSTGGAAGVTSQQVTELADKYQLLTRFSDDQVRASQNMLLTFTSIGKDVFPQATETTLNMATALGQDATQSAMQLGKALNDPINGVTALKRVGVQFTDDQMNQIKALMGSTEELKNYAKEAQTAQSVLPGLQIDLLQATQKFDSMASSNKTSSLALSDQQQKVAELRDKIGQAKGAIDVYNTAQSASQNGMTESQRLMEAQKLILGELQKEFGGSAEAAGKTFAGQLDILGHRFDDIKENIGNALLPTLTTLVTKFSDWLGNDSTQKAIADIAAAIAKWATVEIPKIIAKIGEVVAWVETNWPKVQAVIEPVIAEIVKQIGIFTTQTLPDIIATGKTIVAWFEENWPKIQKTIQPIIDNVSGIVTTFVDIVKTLFGQMSSAVQDDTSKQGGIIETGWKMMLTSINDALGQMKTSLQIVLKVMQGDWQGAWDAIVAGSIEHNKAVTTIYGTAGNVLQDIAKTVSKAFSGSVETMWTSIVGTTETQTDKQLKIVRDAYAKMEADGVMKLKELGYAHDREMLNIANVAGIDGELMRQNTENAFIRQRDGIMKHMQESAAAFFATEDAILGKHKANGADMIQSTDYTFMGIQKAIQNSNAASAADIAQSWATFKRETDNGGKSVGMSVTDTMDYVMRRAQAIRDPMRDAGRDAVNGFEQGWTSNVGYVQNMVQRFAASIPEYIRQSLVIHSPSAVMAGLGAMAGEGFAVGLISSLPKVQSATDEMIAPVVQLPDTRGPNQSNTVINQTLQYNGYYNTPPVNEPRASFDHMLLGVSIP